MKKSVINVLNWVFFLVVMASMVIFSIGYFSEPIKSSKYSSADDLRLEYYHKMELDYYREKDNLVDIVDSIIHFYAPTSELHGIVVVDKCEQYEVDVRFVLAQGLIESHYGTKGLARKTNSVWNIYAYDSLGFDQLHKKGKFNHPDRSVEPYLILLNENYLVDGKTEYDLMDNYVNKDGLRYASRNSYEETLKRTFDNMSTPCIESTINNLHMMKLRLNR